jgi:hypothetical protein
MDSFKLILLSLAGWMNRHQPHVAVTEAVEGFAAG